ncbi:BamA/TamA family outer membrane protein [Sphingomonas sp.]|uniref:autotransporter assembly complex protein TamA n=1 Tax=Sphingomonas sp. TaxID=28214 RepID=UPI0025DF6E9A|nr:BamA/TamA family outer membrane protein [Sphingomonas sp.]MBV9527786.1 BamA/TamA family outer membrane protein [Sphingomonas sp.]
MSGWDRARESARLLCAAALGLILASPALAQSQPPPPSPDLDPSAPLDPMPDLGVGWPDLKTSPAASATTSSSDSASDSTSARRYTLTIEGLETVGSADDILAAFRRGSALEADRKDSANAAQIDRRSRADADLLEQLLRSQGYYDADVEPQTRLAVGTVQVLLEATPGEQYKFASVDLPGLDAAGPDAARLRDTFAIRAGDPVIAADVIAGGLALQSALGREGFASAAVGQQDIAVDHRTHLASLTLPVTPGPIARFGSIRVSGRPPFGARHIWTIARFRPGQRFDRTKIEDLRQALIATTLVAVADIRVVPVDGGRTVDLDVRLQPAPSHTIAGAIGYDTGRGASIEGSWQARNFFNPEGALTLRGVLGTSEQLAAIELRRSNFGRRDQVLDLQALASHQKFDAYEARTVMLSADIERQSNFIWQKKWTWTYGATVLATDERGVFDSSSQKDTRTFLIAAAPLSLGYDGSDSLLDPTRGFRLSAHVSPEVSAHSGQLVYARSQIDASAYRPVADGIVAAGRIRLGTILGAGVYDIAPSRRFYAGGGGSVRGYGYQQLGPKDMDGDPIGGRGLAEFALEARIRLKAFGGNFGIVPFLDGGALSTGMLPDPDDLRFAVGLGARYYSSFGPIRIDVGVPLNRQKGDGPVAVTVSLGQAF